MRRSARVGRSWMPTPVGRSDASCAALVICFTYANSGDIFDRTGDLRESRSPVAPSHQTCWRACMSTRVAGRCPTLFQKSITRSHSTLSTALVAGIATCALSLIITHLAQVYSPAARPGGDFTVVLVAARALLGGHNPYAVIRSWATASDPGAALYYPLPAVLVAVPLAWLPAAIAGPVAFGISTGGLAGYLRATNRPILPLLLSAPFLFAASGAQWAPFIMVMGLIPALSGFAIAKPNLGLAMFAYRPSWRGVAGGTALVALSFLILPSWLHDWRAAISSTPFHRMPLRWPGGFIVLLALLRWRRAEARLLVVLACVPQFPFFYDQLLLWLIPDNEREALTLTWCSWLALALWLLLSSGYPSREVNLTTVAPYVIALCYIPCLIFVLRRPNVHSEPILHPPASIEDHATV